tara:strand:- start:1 stop:192 length:192 start_codon:yes stop_codon:yes gene_type:complete
MDKLNQFLNDTTEALKTKNGMTNWISKHGYLCRVCNTGHKPDWIAYENKYGYTCIDCDDRGEE